MVEWVLANAGPRKLEDKNEAADGIEVGQVSRVLRTHHLS